MKSILYIGAVLMIGASIYGFVDYKKTSRNKEFKSLYHEEKKEPVLSKKVESQVLHKEEPFVEIKDIKGKPSLKNQMSKKGGIDDKASELENTENKKEIVENKSDEIFKKNKKLNYKLFSRAPLRDYSEELILPK